MKFKTNHSEFFKEWRIGNVRILNDIHANVFLRYSVQTFDGRCWTPVKFFRTLAEAKKAAEWVAEDMAMDASRMNLSRNGPAPVGRRWEPPHPA